MTLTEQIIKLVNEDKLSKAMELTETVLYSKISDIMSEKYEEVAPSLFGEAKKAKVTDKDDDGEGMDPVGHGDDDIDNDGDSDDSDDYLKNRRKVIKKAIKKEEVELGEFVQQWDYDNSGQKVGYTNKELDRDQVSKLRKKYPQGSVEKDNDGNHVVYTGQYRGGKSE